MYKEALLKSLKKGAPALAGLAGLAGGAAGSYALNKPTIDAQNNVIADLGQKYREVAKDRNDALNTVQDLIHTANRAQAAAIANAKELDALKPKAQELDDLKNKATGTGAMAALGGIGGLGIGIGASPLGQILAGLGGAAGGAGGSELFKALRPKLEEAAKGNKNLEKAMPYIQFGTPAALALLGAIGGRMAGNSSKKETEKSASAELIGLADAMEKSARGGKWNNMWSEMFGQGTSALLPALLGAGIGAGVSSDRGEGALTGGVVGLGASQLANLIGLIAGLASKRRSATEQKEYDDSSDDIQTNLLLPGVSGFNAGKRMRAKVTDDSNELNNMLPEQAGNYLSNALTLIPGVGAGVAAANGIGTLVGAVRPGRSAAEQTVYDQSTGRGILNLIPGMSNYNTMRRMKADV